MNRRWVSLAVLAGIFLVGCGGVEPASEPESLGTVSSELVSCSAYCSVTGTTLSCTGNACGASNDNWVQCDGNYQYCPTSTCTANTMCDNWPGVECSPNKSRLACCNLDGTESSCVCMNGQWVCPQ